MPFVNNFFTNLKLFFYILIIAVFLGIIHNMYNSFFQAGSYHPLRQPEYRCPLNKKNLSDIFASCSDFEMREISFGLEKNVRLSVCWLDGIVSGSDVSSLVLRPLTQFARSSGAKDEQQAHAAILAGGVYSYSVKECLSTDETVSALTHGHCAVIFDGLGSALCFEVRSDKARSVSEPTLEKALKGAKDSFVETLRVNTALVRRRICSPKLKLIESTIGRKSSTRVAVMFIDGVAAPDTVAELARRLDALDVDSLLAVGILEESLVDNPGSPFPQLLHTERPDRFAMYLMDGRVGLLVDGIPVGLVLPVTFAEFMKVTGDANIHYLITSSISLVRYLSLALSALLPALYVAVSMYHQEMIPTRLLLSIINAKQNVPFSTALEVLGMLIAFTLLQEAGLRLPDPIGDTVSIIGVLIVGQSAVEARVISPIAIIVVALSGIACYTLPSQDMGGAIRLSRFALLLAAIAAGLFGVAVVSCWLVFSLAKIDSFGTSYTAPLSDGVPFSLTRILFRIPKTQDKYRDPLLRTPDRRRQK